MDFPAYATTALTAGATKLGAAAYGTYLARRMMKPTPYRNASRINALTRQVYLNTSELRQKQNQRTAQTVDTTTRISTTLLNNVGLGTSNEDRSGNRIRVTGIRLRVKVSNPVLDVYLILSKDGLAPALTNFNANKAGFLDRNSNMNYKELAYMRCYGADGDTTSSNNPNGLYTAINKKFRRPIFVTFNGGSGTPYHNSIYLVVVNQGVATHNYDMNAIVYFRDK